MEQHKQSEEKQLCNHANLCGRIRFGQSLADKYVHQNDQRATKQHQRFKWQPADKEEKDWKKHGIREENPKAERLESRKEHKIQKKTKAAANQVQRKQGAQYVSTTKEDT